MNTLKMIAPAVAVAAAIAAVMMLLSQIQPVEAAPTCAGTLGIESHGQHIVGDYVTGIGRADLDWPPSHGVVGSAIAGKGAHLPGGPGPGFHFEHGFAPGASFCLDQSQSPGDHPGP